MQLHNNSFQAAFDYVYKHYFDDYDWFMKADDDTYVIMENLRYFLSGEDKKEPIYFGHFFLVSQLLLPFHSLQERYLRTRLLSVNSNIIFKKYTV